jgi:hypothetical protein
MTKDIHVVPGNEGWELVAEGQKTPLAKTRTKHEAVREARVQAMKRDVGVVVHKKNGQIQERYEPGGEAVHVVPHGEHWDVVDRGAVVEHFDSKYSALRDGKSRAKAQGSDLVVHYKDGTVQDRFNPQEQFRPAIVYLGA